MQTLPAMTYLAIVLGAILAVPFVDNLVQAEKFRARGLGSQTNADTDGGLQVQAGGTHVEVTDLGKQLIGRTS